MKKYAIIVAGGSGIRMGADMPKQFLKIHELPIIAHTLKVFLESDFEKIVVVLPSDHVETFVSIKKRYLNDAPNIEMRIGGETRFKSVQNGLKALQNDKGYIAVHDAVRPMVSPQIIKDCFDQVLTKHALVTAVRSKDSIRFGNEGVNKAIQREEVYLVQTPQVFESELLKRAYLQEDSPSFTDDASVVESINQAIYIVEGSYRNIKITSPEDLLVAETYLKPC